MRTRRLDAGRVIWPIAVLYVLSGAAAPAAAGLEPPVICIIVIGLMAAFAAYAVRRSA